MSENEMDVEDDSGYDDSKKVDNNEQRGKASSEVYLPGGPLAEGEELVCDQTAYIMLHQAQSGSPCLSFDIIKDNLGDSRSNFPLTSYIVAGTQAAQAHVNNVIVMKLSNLHRTSKDDESQEDEEESDEEDDAKRPQMAATHIKHQGCVNRIRSTFVNGNVLAATWSELGRVNIWNLTKQLTAVDNSNLLSKYNQENTANSVTPIFTFSGHQQEGFAVDWSNTAPGVLATGDCKKNIHVWHPAEGGKWGVDQRPLIGHTHSVEDVQWSSNERNVLASCSVDKSIRIWDTRAAPNKACMLTADNSHKSDVNVISWSGNEPFLVSGGDDGFLHIWDLRRFQEKKPVATFKHHTEPVTTVEWHPTEAAIFASGGSDNQIALWDLSIEKDADAGVEEVEGIPPQLLFIHQGQTDVKELHWHSQVPGLIISTALSGFNLFKTISV